MKINISTKLKEICPDIVLGCVTANVLVEKSNDELVYELKIISNEIEKNMKLEDIKLVTGIHDTREVYKKLGKKPSRYRPSSEALLRRIVQGKGMYFINNVVDINNLISIKSGFVLGAYDLDKLNGPITFDVGNEGDIYEGIGKGSINIENLPLFEDQEGFFGSPTSDSERSMIKDNTKNILMVIISFSGIDSVSEYLDELEMLLQKYANAESISKSIVKKELITI